VVERVIHHEDHRTIDELREKCESLRERLWEHQSLEEDMRARLSRLSVLEARDSRWKSEFHAVVVRAKNGRRLPDIELRLIDSKSYFLHRADPEAFKERLNLKDPFLLKELPFSD
jgi:hypothetical protein